MIANVNVHAVSGSIPGPNGVNADANVIEETGTLTFLTNLK